MGTTVAIGWSGPRSVFLDIAGVEVALTVGEQVAAAQGHPVVRLFTNKLFAANVQLYGKLGYGVDREEKSRLGITVYMSKPVQAEG